MNKCKHCKMDIEIRNPSGFCDHLYYPDMCEVCKPKSNKDTDRRKLELYDRAITLLKENQNILDDQFVDILLAEAAELEKTNE